MRTQFYVRTAGKPDSDWIRVVGVLRRLAPESKDGFLAHLHGPSGTIVVGVPDAGELQRWDKAIARETGHDVVGLAIDLASDAFLYEHYVDSKLVRQLDYGVVGPTRTWNAIGGNPEPWEATVIFSKDVLPRQVEKAPDDAAKLLVRQIHAERRLRLGVPYPSLGTVGITAMADLLKLPGTVDAPTGGWAREERVEAPKPAASGLFGWFRRK